MTITPTKLRDLLDYQPLTGLFAWREDRAPDIKAGDVAGTWRSDGYIAIRIEGRKYQAHRLAWLYLHGSFPAAQIDHINGAKWDNRIENLRVATNAQNCRNRGRRADNKSGFKGVSFEARSGKWRANAADAAGRWRSLGRFASPEEASAAYEKFTAAEHGQFKHQGQQA